MRVLRWLPSLVVLLPWLLSPLTPSNEVRVRDLAGPSAFGLLEWETLQLGQRLDRLWSAVFATPDGPASDDTETLRLYFATPPGARAPIRSAAETAIERVVGAAYRAEGLTQARPVPLPTDRLFPPLLIALTSPPNVLVISPRTELRVVQSSVLQPLDGAAQQQIEGSADSTGVSSLVAPIGGLATYPSMVLDEDSAPRVMISVAHEWLHQYLIFYPLGMGYFSSQETREINETTADMIGAEVGAQVVQRLDLPDHPPAQPSSSTFDFRGFMRQTRAQTEQLLEAGQVDAAESYMSRRRDELQQHDYHIRKLNQAYFALYGSYGDGFAASPTSPISALLHTLRDRSPTLGDFVLAVRGLTSVADLRRAVG